MRALLLLALMLGQGAEPLPKLVERAQADFEAGRYSEARVRLLEAVNRSPNDPRLWSYLGMADAQLKDLDASIKAFEKARVLDPHDAQTCFNLGLLFRQRGEADKALAIYQQGLALSPDDQAANQNYGLLLMEKGRYRQAAEPFARLKAKAPSLLSVRVALIEAYLKGGMPDPGLKEISEFLDPSVSSPGDQLQLAKVLLEDREADAAQRVLEHVVEVSPDLPEAHERLGAVFLNQSKYEDATRELGRAVQLSPDSAEYAMRLAEALLLWQHHRVALEFLTAVKDKFGSLPEYQYKVGLAYYGLHQYPLAIEQLEAIARRQPNLDRVHFFLGNSYLATGDLEKAEAAYRRAIALNAKDASYYSALAQLLLKRSDSGTGEAIQDLRQALALNPVDAKSQQELALCYEKQAKYADAERLLRQAVEEQPDLLSAHVALARVYYREKKKEQGDRERQTVSTLEARQQAQQSELAKSPSSQ